MVTYSHFMFVSVYGLITTSKFFSVKRVIPLKDYAILVTMFFVSTVSNNYSFNFNIAIPLLMVFRSGSLMANMVMGIFILKKKYDFWKYFSVVLITIGIFICTISTGMNLKEATKEETESQHGFSQLFWWCIGVLMMTISLFVSARMGLYQEVLYKKNGKHPDEALFYTHFLPLPAFLPLLPNVLNHLIIAVNSTPVNIFGIEIPNQVAFLIGNILTHYLCIRSVYVLTTECVSLTVTLVVTLRKFSSLLFSIFYFRNSFTVYHWIGTAFVFIGTVTFVEIIPKTLEIYRTKQQRESIDKFYLDSQPRAYVDCKPLLQDDEDSLNN